MSSAEEKEPKQVPAEEEDEDEDEEEVPEIDASEGEFQTQDDEPVMETLRWAADNGFERRTSLPVPHLDTPNDGLWSILKKNMGKKLSNISMPVTVNEPISALQRLCEELEYSTLLDQAAFAEKPHERLMFIAAFAVSSYAPTFYRNGRKPFNPVLGETFDCVRPERGFRFVAEQVSHHPPISVCFAESQHWNFFQEASAKTKTRPSCLKIIPQGYVRIELPMHNEVYEYRKVTTSVEDIMSSNKWVDHHGKMIVTNITSGDFARVDFHQHTVFKKSRKHDVHGYIFARANPKSPVLQFDGKWHENLTCKQTKEVIWKADTPSKSAQQAQFGFTTMAIELNELPPEESDVRAKMLPTDSRFRPDQRLYEDAKIAEAQAEKTRVEDMQRKTRAAWEAEGKKWRPRFFDYRRVEVTSPYVELKPTSPRVRRKSGADAAHPAGKTFRDEWVYKGGFWKAKRSGEVPPCHDLW